MRVCAFTSVCQEDYCWVDQYLAEVDRIRIPFVVHFDRCSKELKRRMMNHWGRITFTEQDNSSVEFTEQAKQGILDLVQDQGYGWALAWDIDETYEKDADAKIRSIEERTEDCLDTPWLNLWGDMDHIRIDSGFAEGHRVKLYNLQEGRRWVFDHPITNGAKLEGREAVLGKLDLTCLHHGMMSHELRLLHKERWDRIYSKALKGDKNPYGFWRHALDPNLLVITLKHRYHS